MKRIFTIGESAYDILFKNNKPYDGKVGGAVINTSISLGRLGCNIHLIGNLADDEIGRISINFLEENYVNTEYFTVNPDSQSRISLAFIDDPNQPHYLFYKVKTENTFQLTFPEITSTDILLFSSLYSIRQDNYPQIHTFLKKANQSNAILYYDPNFRKNHLKNLPDLLPNILNNISLSDIIKGSDEDFETIFGFQNLQEIVEKLDVTHKKIILYTRGKKNVMASIFGQYLETKIEEVETKSAVGAGDSFNAGFVWELYRRNILKENIHSVPLSVWTDILRTATKFAAHVCTRDENYISKSFAETIQKKL